MAKKKAKQKRVTISAERYMQTRVRNLPVEECLVTEGFFDYGEGNIVIMRKHVSGNVTVGVFLVDTYCLGVKKCFYRYNISEEDYFSFFHDGSFAKIGYNEAHNLVYGSVAYAEDFGIKPHKNFGITRYILEPDTEEIPLIEYEFGRNGKPCLIVETYREATMYMPFLREHVGDNFDLVINGEEYDDEFDDEYGDEFDDEYDDELDSSIAPDFQNTKKGNDHPFSV